MNTRRNVIAGALAIAGTAGIEGSTIGAVRGGTGAAGARYPITEDETHGKLVPINDGFPPGDVRRFGIIEHSPESFGFLTCPAPTCIISME
jgi:hypothetical protein